MNFERLVLGTAGIGGVWGRVSPGESVETVLYALERGVSAIDTAPAYGDAEALVGKALAQWKGSMPRVSSKVGRLRAFTASEGKYNYSRAAMFRSVNESRQRLGLAELDTLFLHDPAQVPASDAETVMEVMHEFREQKLMCAAGVGGNPPEWLWHWLRQGAFDALMEHNRLNACQTPALETSLPVCNQCSIRYYAASPLNMGALGSSYTLFSQAPPSWLPLQHISAARQLKLLADAAGMPLQSLAHRFLLSIPFSFNIVIGPSNMAELAQTLNDFEQGPLPDSLYKLVLEQSQEKNA